MTRAMNKAELMEYFDALDSPGAVPNVNNNMAAISSVQRCLYKLKEILTETVDSQNELNNKICGEHGTINPLDLLA